MEKATPEETHLDSTEPRADDGHMTMQITDNPVAHPRESPNLARSSNRLESSRSLEWDAGTTTIVTIQGDGINSQIGRSHTKSSSFVAESVASESSILQINGNAGYLTLTGTIRRGKKAGQTTEIVVPVDKERLDFLESVVIEQQAEERNSQGCGCGCDQGIHILLWSLCCVPFIFIFSVVYSFYLGTITWHNVFVLFSEEKSCIYKLFVPPILIVCFPILVIPCAIVIALYASVAQISWRWQRWVEAAFDLEKGYFGWLCTMLGIDECAPYQEIVLNEVQHVKRPEPQP